MSAKPTNKLFITPQYLIENSAINSNVEQKILTKCIRSASDKYIMPLIGSNLYEAIVNKISGGTMAAGDYKSLLDDYITPALVDYSVLEYIPFSAVKFRNKGIQRQNSGENSEPADMDNLTYLQQSVRDSAQFYSERLVRYLKANIQLFPEYYQYTISIDDVMPARSDYFSGIQFPQSNRGNRGTFGMGLGTPINF